MQKQKNKETGITLIALVVSIIVLIILAGVSIAMLVGENGIITQAQRADELTTQAQQKEAIELAVASVQAQGTLELDKTKLELALQSQLGDTEYSLTENGDGSFWLQITERSYYIESTGKVIEEENMIAIGSAEELETLRDDVNNGNTYEGKYVYLTSDITLDINEEWEPIGVYSMENDTPDDENNKPFSGIFDGKGYEINGIYINTTDKVQGLFGLVTGGKILNLGIGIDCNISGNLSVGAIAGYLYNGSKAINCYNKSNLKVGSYSGGLFGQLAINCSIENCYNIGNINVNNDSRNTGGVVGNVSLNSSLKKCYNKGTVEGNISTTSILGGISGNLSDESLLEECFNLGAIQGNNIIGGILGQVMNNGIVQNCYNVGNIKGESKIGGISGQSVCNIFNCYNIGEIEGNVRIGGIVGENNISSSYHTTGVLKNTYSLKDKCEAICGYNNSIIEDSSIKSEEKMKLLVSTLGASFKEDIDNINNGYPILIWQRDPTMVN